MNKTQVTKILTLLCILIPLVSASSNEQLKPTKYGDINGDSYVDKLDLLAMENRVDEYYGNTDLYLTEEQIFAMDFNEDFVVDSKDTLIFMDWYHDGIESTIVTIGQPVYFT